MRLRWIKIIYAKEILETLRDRRTLFILIALPILLYPILFLLMGTVIESHIENIVKKRVTLEIWGEPPEGLLSSFNENKNEKFEVTTIPESPADTDVCLRAREKLLEKKIEAVMLIGSDITCEPQKEGPGYEIADHGPMGNFIVLYDGANDYSSSGATYVSNVLEKFTKNIVRQNLQQAGLDPDLEQPFFIKRSNLAGEQRMGGHYAGGILPMLLILMVVLGAFYPAIDLSAGEKERGTLETLITAPVHPAEIVAGKYLAVVTISLIASGMNLLSMGLTINRMADQFTDGKFVLSIGGAAMVLVMLVPTVFFFSALMLAIASLARDYKEAQTYLTPTYIIILLPAMIGGMPGIELNWATAFAPVINITLIIKQTLLGEVNAESVFMVMLANSAYAIMALILADKLFKSEAVLFATAKPFKNFSIKRAFAGLRKDPRPGQTPTPAAAMMFFSVCLVLIYYMASVFQATDAKSGLLITEWVLFLVPALLVALFFRYDPIETFSLRLPSFTGFAGSALVGLSAWTLGILSVMLTEVIFPMPEAFSQAMTDFFNVAVEGLTPWSIFFLFALSPAICEEAIFRGIIFSGLKKSLGKWPTIIVVGLLFGIFHLSIYRILPTAILGMVVTYAVWQTRSILVGVIIHFLNNSLYFAAEQSPMINQFLGWEDGKVGDWTRFALFMAVLAGGLALLAFQTMRKKEPSLNGS